ncbi:MAG: GAF domain-containing protein [Aggregatilineales bacterium]
MLRRFNASAIAKWVVLLFTLVAMTWMALRADALAALLLGALAIGLTLYRPPQQRDGISANQLEAFNTTIQRLILVHDRDQVTAEACKASRSISGASAALLLLSRRANGLLDLGGSVGLNDAQQRRWRALGITEEKVDLLVAAPDLARISGRVAEAARADGYRALVSLPLRSGPLTLGALVVLYRQPGVPPPPVIGLLQLLAAHIALRLDHHDLLRALETHTFETTQLVRLSSITTVAMEIDRLAAVVTSTLCEMANGQRAVLALRDQHSALLRLLRPPTTEYETIALDTFPELAPFIEAPRAQAVQFLRDRDAVSEALGALLDRFEASVLAVFPLVANDELLGLVFIARELPEPFHEREWQLLTIATNQIAVHVQNAQLYASTNQALQRRLEQLALIEDLAQHISSALDFDQIIVAMLEAALRASQADVATFMRLADTGNLWTIIQQRPGSPPNKAYRSRGRQDALIEEVLRSREPVVIEDARAYPYEFAGGGAGRSLSLVAVPLLIRDQTASGVLVVESARPAFFKEEQVRFLSSLAGHTAISIENARLLEDRQHQINTLRSLQALTLRLSSAIPTFDVAATILETARDMLDVGEAELFQLTGDGLFSLSRLQNAHTTETAFDQAAALRVARSGEIHISEQAGRAGVVAYVPIRYSGSISAVLTLSFRAGTQIRQRDMNSIALLASQAAGHLENARLYEHIRIGNDRMRALLNSARDGILLLDRDGILVECNPMAERLLGIEREIFLGRRFVEMLQKILSVQEQEGIGYSRDELDALARQLRTGSERITSRQFKSTRGTQTLYIDEIGAPVRDDQGEIVGRLLVLRDITEQRLLEEYRDEITHMAVHDLRGPLWAIASGISLALEDIAALPGTEVAQKTLRLSLQSANNLTALVDSLLDISRLEQRQMPLQRGPAMVTDLIASARAALLPALEEANIRFQARIQPNLPPLDVDAEIVRRVLINLLDNAIRHTPDGERILFTAARRGAMAVLRIADSGSGIPPGDRERIFERFRQSKEVQPLRGARGSGLGLTFCRLAVEAHGGAIAVDEASPLPGASISFTLPLLEQIAR